MTKHIGTYIQKSGAVAPAVLILFLFGTTVMPVETRWSQAEMMMAYMLPALCLWAVLCSISGKEKLKVTLLDTIVAFWGIYYFFRVWLGGEFPCATQFIKDASGFILYFALKFILARHPVSPLCLIAPIMLFGFYEAVTGLCQMFDGTSRHYLYMLTGTFLNPGPYSAYLLIAIVTGLTARHCLTDFVKKMPPLTHRYVFGLYYLALSLPVILLPATWSRAAIIALAAVCLWYFRNYYWRWRYVVWGICLVALVALYFIKQGSADGRILIWTASLVSLRHNLWTGAGIGGFRHSCAEGIAELFAANPDNKLLAMGGVSEYAFCDLLKILAEQGLVGAILCVAVAAVIMYNLKHWSTPLFYATGALLIFSLFSYPFEQYPYRVVFIVIAAASDRVLYLTDMRRGLRIATSVAGIAMGAASVYLANEAVDRRNADKEAAFFADMCHTTFINDYYELLPKENDNPRFLFKFAKTLGEAGRYNESNAVLRQGALISNDPMFYVLQGNNYSDMRYYDLAEKAYQKAYSVMPNRLYPLYKLMLLYQDIHQYDKMRDMAQAILRTRPKVASPATEDIINKAKELI